MPSGDGMMSVVVKLFGSVAETYQQIRPGYELSIADDILAYHGSRPGTVAEIGAGTGKATQVLQTLGGRLICVEPDPRMAAGLPSSAEVFPGTFEEWVAPQGGVDVLACALAWHWLDEATRLSRSIDALAPGGTLAVIAHAYAYVDPEHSAAIAATFKAQDAAHGKGEVAVPDQFWFYQEIAGSGRFERVECRVTAKDHPMSSDEYVRLVSTFSPFLQRTQPERQELAEALRSTVDGLGGTIVLDLRTTLVLATPRSTCREAEALVATTG
jgi:trans-aconitate methyltransferase